MKTEDISKLQKEMQKLLAEKIQSQKGLSIIYTINKVISRKSSIDKTLNEIVGEITKAWQFSEYCHARIKYDGQEYRLPGFRETRWIQKQIFETYDKKWGAIDVFYTKQFPKADEGPFLHEERQLLENIATIVSNYLNSQQGAEQKDEGDQDVTLKLERSRRLSEEKNIEDALSQISRNMPKSWQYPEHAVARILYDGKEYLSSDKDFSDSQLSLKEEFTTINHKSGTIELHYLKGFPATLEESYLRSEEELLGNMANLITGFINIIKGNEIRQPADREEEGGGKKADNRIFASINEISKRLRSGTFIESTLNEILEVIPRAFRFPDEIRCRIIYEDLEFSSPRLSETSFYITAAFKTITGKSGSVQVFYTGEGLPDGEEPFLEEEKQYVETLALLISGFINLICGLDSVLATEEGMKEILYEKTERIKELACINQTTSILQAEKSVEKALKQIVYILPDAWQYPENTVARISFDNNEYMSPNFTVTKWRQRQPFLTIDDKFGEVEIYYTKEFPDLDEGPFMKEERDLINNISTLICNYLNSVQGEVAIKKYRSDEELKEKYQAARDYLLNKRKLLQNFLEKNNYDRDIFHDLMKFKVKEILIISNLYDAYSLEREGKFSDYILGVYYQLNLTSIPRITGVSSFEEAFEKLYAKHYDLIIIMVGVDRKTPLEIASKLKALYQYIPIYLLLNNNQYVGYFQEEQKKTSLIDNVFVWNGDSRIFFAMVKQLEDFVNVDNDTRVGYSRIILLVEDSAKYYSRYIPLLYHCVMEQTRRIIEDVSPMDELYKVLRLRVRPKILMASNYEEAIQIFNKYKDFFLCLITDVKFDKNSKFDENAGFELVSYVKSEIPDLPTIIQSSDRSNEKMAKDLNCVFIHKNSDTLAQDIRAFISYNLGFGDFIYQDETGRTIGTARNMNEFEEQLQYIPTETLLYHARRNHFSLWLTARGEIQLAREIAPKKTSDFKDPESLRDYLVKIVKQLKYEKNKGKIVEFDETLILEESNIIQLSPGALGGKGRGLAFIHTLIYNFDIANYVPGINIKAPRTFIIGTNEFEDFLDNNKLRNKIYSETNYETIKKLFVEGKLSQPLVKKLQVILEKITKPLAVRSSGLFEDSLMQPFAGIFETYLLPNSNNDVKVRLKQLTDAIKLVYASIYSETARGYISAINYKIEEEKMAVIIQEVVGEQYENVYYPHISGVSQSYNYYPYGYMQPEDGFAVIAVGLGTYVVEGEKAFRFSPKYPNLENNTPKDQYLNSQVEFFAVDLDKKEFNLLEGDTVGLSRLSIEDAERHGAIKHCASVYSAEAKTIYPGIDKAGPRVINFADILKYDYIPLAKSLVEILDIVKEALGTPVEIEFAVDLTRDSDYKASFHLLQIKPIIGAAIDYEVNMDEIDRSQILLYTEKSMGNGMISNIRDVIYVDKDTFDKSKTLEIAGEIDAFNAEMIKSDRQYILLGPGRWGTRDRWIGIPVTWPQICNAKVIIETGLEDFPLDASSGSHFFHNVTSMNVGYFSVQHNQKNSVLNWEILGRQKVVKQRNYVRHVQFKNSLTVKMDGKKRISVITWE
ncbi:MAG: PEP/pyruvate-binding domain-containing protein [Bacteroidales bacterium]|nr:PEP/pyruvate-binding domain-containing protein [Bacteroidales bacterium]MDT8373279.1 PEP/pyruvate-binding domain-containing protein [Bacteroidales bacterium]